MTRVITIASGKGGVGKTTLTVNLGVALSSFGEKVILLDADVAMANLELVLCMEDKFITLYDVLLGDADIHDAVYDGPAGMKVIPAGVSLQNLRNVKIERLNEVLTSLIGETDILLIDAPAGLEKGALTAIAAAAEIIIITTPEVPSVADALKTKIVASKLGINIIGAVVNRCNNDKIFLSVREIESILEIPVISSIPEDPQVSRASVFGEPFVIKNIQSPAYNSIMQLGADIVGASYTPVGPDKEGVIAKLFQGLLGKR
ncbi:cell division ATPase MinD [Methanobacterium petrolearium]|uniref:cell division ATPase MinD n=1 Tax=Methanobacterium petrolearium TaxID=710190 RepID=UPI001AE8DE98|nr:cell division ATPase MinD [Methanobacterium petrolearium]MBP1944679.1 septum site-determining protein MinD [Methanobacterium petrolearium]BDZ69945.1 septum site-determining protein MinD [Methanobacterium petrolearium]